MKRVKVFVRHHIGSAWNKTATFFTSRYGPMAVLLVMYGLKIPAKISVGRLVGMEAIEADGFHNTSDFAEGWIAIWLMWLVVSAASKTFPIGKKNLASLFRLVVGAGLIGLALKVGINSLSVLFDVLFMGGKFPGAFASEYATLALVLTIVSVAMSFPVSYYQIKVGERLDDGILIADGQETRSDALLEVVIVVGLAMRFFAGWAWIEHVFTLIVAGLITRTGYEIGLNGLWALLQRAIGEEHDKKIREIVSDMYGVHSVKRLITFMVGPMAVVLLDVEKDVNVQEDKHLIRAMKIKISHHLELKGMRDHFLRVEISEPTGGAGRITVAIVCEKGNERVAHNLAEATHVTIVDITQGRPFRSYDEEIVQGIGFQETLDGLIALLVKKKVQITVVAPGEHILNPLEVAALKRAGIRLEAGPTDWMSTYGIWNGKGM